MKPEDEMTTNWPDGLEASNAMSNPPEQLAGLAHKAAGYGSWINIDEYPPPFNEPVLVHQPNWKGQPVTVAELESIDEGGFRFQFDLTRARVDRRNARYSVTHWMPLPKAP